MLLVFFPPFTLELELKPQQSMVWKGLLEIICLEISLAVAGLRFDYSGHYQAEPQIFFFFQQEDSTTSLSNLFQSSVVLTEYFHPYIHLYFPLQQLVPITSDL